MKKLLLVLHFAGLGLLTMAQQTALKPLKDNKLQNIQRPESVVFNTNPSAAANHNATVAGGARASVLNSQPIGTAGNLLTAIESGNNQIYSIDSLNLVTFIHRNDPSNYPGTNVAQYRFDKSTNRGQTWSIDLGPITNDFSIDNINVNGRFPEAVVYNPAGNTNADSAWFVYSGTWHDGENGSWQGSMRGRGKISGDTSTFDVHIDQVNSGNVSIGTGFCQSVPGTFWKVNEASNVSFATGVDVIISGVVVEKGVFDNNTKTINWTETVLPANFEENDGGGFQVSVATSMNIAFDPSGQNGWISCLGDITSGDDSVYEPIFWQTTDGGQNWTGPTHVVLEDIEGVMNELSPVYVDGTTPSSMNPTTAFDADLTVDADGNPHLLVVIGNGSEYSMEPATYDVWDITYDASANAGCQWKGYHLADINTFRGTFSSGATPQTEDNRPMISRSEDGTKLFFFWLESDIDFTLSPDNDVPNLFGRAINIDNGTMTGIKNFSETDSLWGGATVANVGGVFQGVTFPIVGQYALQNGNIWNVPFVFTQIDYNNTSGGLGDAESPAAFWYINNINFANSEFNQNADQIPPTITLNGADTVTILVNTPYTELGATAFDCNVGNINPTVISTVDTSAIGYYTVTYIASDGVNADTVVRTVIVGSTPVAAFTWTNPQIGYKFNFQDQSLNIPTSFQWNFGDSTGSIAQNPVKTYYSNGTRNVCLTVSNSFGSNQVCQNVTVTQVGIDDITFGEQLKMFPNPTTGLLNITVDGNVSPNMTVTVFNLLGEEVVSPAFYKAGTTNMQVDLSGVSNGLYLVKVQSINGTAVKQISVNSAK